MTDAHERAHLERLLTIYRRNLEHLTQQAAMAGGEALASIAVRNQLDDTREKIAELERQLGLGAGPAAPAPTAPTPATASPTAPAPATASPTAPAPATASPTAPDREASPAQPLQISLEFRQEATGPWITWRSASFGRADTPFAPPYSEGALPMIIRALDVLQYPGYPTPANDQERGHFTFSDGAVALLEAHQLWREGRVAPEAPRLVGQALYRGLGAAGQALITTIRNASIAQGLQASYSLRFPQASVALAALPWELLWDDEKNQAVLLRGARVDSCERSMDLDIALPPGRPAAEKPHLLAMAPSYGIPEALYRAERAARLQSWGELRERGLISFDEITPLTVARLNDYLLGARRRPDIIHFYGHGSYRDGKGCLQFDGEGGGADLVSAERLASLLGDPHLIVLQACQSAMVDQEASLLSGIAPALSIAAGAVVAMQLTVRVGAANRFTQVLYGQLLGQGRSLQEAVARARQVLFTEASAGDSWYVPTLYIRSREQRPVYLLR